MVAKTRFEEIELHDHYAVEVRITETHLDRFADLSGDVSPLHMDAGFARSRGFSGRVAHGMLTLGFFSRLVGVHLPGENALLHSVNVRFQAPVYVGDPIVAEVIVDQKSEENRILVLKVTARHAETAQILAQGKIQVGFTQSNRED